MKLLAVSGGPDSMLLLDRYKNTRAVVAHVNYNLREDSNKDQRVVQSFCQNNNVRFEVLNVTTKPQKNIEAWARKIRYDFFHKIYQKYGCRKVLTAHHKDDFLETAIMQQQTNRFPEFLGIRKTIAINQMHVYRPFVDKYWKTDVLFLAKKKNLPFVVDATNKDLKFLRNKTRAEISNWTPKKKQSYYQWFCMANRILQKKCRKVNNLFLRWEKQGYGLNAFQNLPRYKEEIVFKYVHKHFSNAKLSHNKINGVIDFIEASKSDTSKCFKVSDQHFLYKKNKKLVAK